MCSVFSWPVFYLISGLFGVQFSGSIIGYSNQFSPEQFLHLELQPLSDEKIKYYAEKWVDVKVTIEDEQVRVLNTLAECQKEEHTRLLLATPLQVTIVLLIIKDGGHPPAQREALFSRYWDTILRREKAKTTGIIRTIRTEDIVLFELHAYLGYILHLRAAVENVRSLLPEAEFKRTVYDLLRENNRYSPEEIIGQQVAQMIKEASDRLVLLVSPEPGLFGFELRPLQEFFAAAYLAKTAKGTEQRFKRLKAIACSEHWRNVALFFAGWVVRNVGGEAEKILVDVCMPIDRTPSDRYLRRGAWLALDIAADGVFAANRNLQNAALEHALTVLETGMNEKDSRHLDAALARLSPDDCRDILRPLLQQKLASQQLSCLAKALNVYAQSVGTDETLLNGLEALLSSGKPKNIEAVLDLGFRYQVKAQWLATQLERYWMIQTNEPIGYRWTRWWQQSPEYFQSVLSICHLSVDQVSRFLGTIQPRQWRYWEHRPDRRLPELPSDLRSPADQIIMTFYCLSLLIRSLNINDASIDRIVVRKVGSVVVIKLKELYDALTSSADLMKVTDLLFNQLLPKSDLLPPVRASLWSLYWLNHEPNEPMVSAFLEDIQSWDKTNFIESILVLSLSKIWPLLGIAARHALEGDQQIVKQLKPHLNKAEEFSINQQVRSILHVKIQNVSSEEWDEFMLNTETGEVNDESELCSIAKRLGIAVNELVEGQILYRETRDQRKCSSQELQRILSSAENSLAQPHQAEIKLMRIANVKWHSDQEILSLTERLFTSLVDKLGDWHEGLRVTTILFLKRLAIDSTTLSLAPQFLTVLGHFHETEQYVLPWDMAEFLLDIPFKSLDRLARFTEYEDETIRQGALNLWDVLIDAILMGEDYMRFRSGRNVSKLRKLRSLRFDWQRGLSLTYDADEKQRKHGVRLLALSDFPAADTIQRTKLLNAIAKTQESEEEIWCQFLRQVPLPTDEKTCWIEFFESILGQPRIYSSDILSATMERYTALMGEVNPGILGNDQDLGLPPVTVTSP
jgi:hypothetical protein